MISLWRPAYIAVGSNLDGPVDRVRAALDALAALADVRLLRRSSLWRSAPFGFVDQPDFVNAVAALLTTLDGPQLLARLRALEVALGRESARQRWGPRHIDLDLLSLGLAEVSTPQLVLPHPGIVERNFVLYPLDEIAPDAWIPALGRVADLATRVSSRGIERLPETA